MKFYECMRVLNLSLDKAILEKDSPVQKRLLSLAQQMDKLTVLVPGEKDEERELSAHLNVYSVSGSKLVQLWKLWRVGKKVLTSRNPSFDLGVGVLPLEKGELASFDLITAQDTAYLGLLAYLLARHCKLPLEVQVHGLEKFSGLRMRIARHILKKTSRIRVVSERLKQLLITDYRLSATKIYVLPVITQITSSEKSYKRKTVPVPFTFLTVGRLVPVKNIALQIHAFARLAREYPQVHLRIVGDGPLAASLKLQVESLKVQDKVSFEGHQKELGRQYEEADAFLLTSDYEGWGRVALEAAAHGLPIIMTNVGLANEALHHDKECIVIPVGDELQLLGAMQELVDKPGLRERLGKVAYKTFKSLPGKEEQIRQQVSEWRSLR